MVGYYWHASETPFQWRFAGGANDGPLLVAFQSPTIPSAKKKPKKKLSVLDQGRFCRVEAHMICFPFLS